MALGDPEKTASPQAIASALDAAGYGEADPNALLGKEIGGTDLSGGQWQKLAIARAHYRGRNFVLLDEPTGNLDPLAEAEVFQKYLDLSQGKTLIMVTHRISVASLADRIVVFAGGKIVEDGTHESCSSAAANTPGSIMNRPSGMTAQAQRHSLSQDAQKGLRKNFCRSFTAPQFVSAYSASLLKVSLSSCRAGSMI